MTNTKHVIFASYGNDSVALIQWVYEQGLVDVVVLYSDTGWAIDWWADRVTQAETWVRRIGYLPVQTISIGFSALVMRKKMFPRPGVQFCTDELKIAPAMKWLDTADPDKKAICFVGVRREESVRRQTFEYWRDNSPAHGGRACYAPLADFTEAERDELILNTGLSILPHRSKECFPCIGSNRKDLRMLAEDKERVTRIENLESDMGRTARGEPKSLFRPARYGGATGIREIISWAQAEHGQYNKTDSDADNCDGGFCGT